MLISQTKSNLQPPLDDSVAEVVVEDFSRVLRSHFGIVNEPVTGKPYAVRYTGQPFIHTNQDCKSIQVFAHAKGTRLSPLCVSSVLSKFDIPVLGYKEAILGQGKLIPMRQPANEGRQNTVRQLTASDDEHSA